MVDGQRGRAPEEARSEWVGIIRAIYPGNYRTTIPQMTYRVLKAANGGLQDMYAFFNPQLELLSIARTQLRQS